MATRALTTIGFDADDTLWQNEQFFRLTEDRFVALLGEHGEAAEISGKLLEAEKRNLAFYGFGIKGFTLSMIETAIEITRGQVPQSVIGEILAAGREMLTHPVETLPHAQGTLAALAGRYRLVLITKGDLFDQERKLAQSGLGDFFDAVEIVSDKSAATYTKLFARHGDGPGQALMVGNSLKSDIVPALAAGAWAAYVPHDLTWALEHAEEPTGHQRYRKLADLGGLTSVLRDIES
ncbi:MULTISPECIES: HAD family hydrolase [unclassified Bosea (in: a-proteobacteria)]|uniref:HAD family hydrolase n=1 Tax=unclassified Bosea (in: a-proteobacteria) TaxID=2653178 RepID=UPI000F752250|nr:MULTISPECIES: HAD family hydrolase [unclassified Bosea (in: a-proteobacteria)]AZO78643.1 HAD family hydrolase [Bosea sp. Tri-49]RXT17570.1 HAD family hydrolase [Bosea sp. Tri-39]RXT40942.1 HAD family hydrolase [Bosea sp. Tri-54]